MMKILIIRFSSLGDIVLTQPIVKKLHDVFPEAELYYITKERYAEVLFSFGIPLNIVLFSDLKKCFWELKRLRFDYVFDLQNKLNSFWIKLFCTREKFFTYNKQIGLRNGIVSHRTNKTINSTLELYQSALLKAAKYLKKPELGENIGKPCLTLSAETADKFGTVITNNNKVKKIAVFPGAKHKTKIYPAVYYIKLIQSAGADYHFWLMGGKEDAKLTRLIHEAAKDNSFDYCGKFNLHELMHMINAADAVISGDSGPMHIAAALGKAQIAIFGSTHPKLGFSPLNDKAKVVCKDIECQPCSLHGREACPLKHFSCMLSIEPDEILSLLNSIQ